VKITAARFLGATAAASSTGDPSVRLPVVAVAGRSNVGKSSLLNTLLGRRGLARTSRTPGRTRQLNFFLVNERFVVADLPGYGFAVGSEAERRSWGPLVEGFLRDHATLRGVVLLVDARRGLEAEEDELLAFLAHVRLPAAVVATKLDKLGRGAAGAALATLRRRVGQATPVVGFSARTGEGRDALWRVLREWLDRPPRAETSGGL
jgi:GTP-binding protein